LCGRFRSASSDRGELRPERPLRPATPSGLRSRSRAAPA
jgi:hypothetical protein